MSKSELNLHDFELFIFDWDGVLADSLGTYRELDKLFVKEFYGIDKPVDFFYELADKIKTGAVNSSEDDYFLYIDALFGNGKTPIEVLWENIYKYAPVVQAKIDYKQKASEALRGLRAKTQAPIALATSSSKSDITFFSTDDSETAKRLRPLEFFDTIITIDDVKKPKPHPEAYIKIIKKYNVDPKKVLVFEDSLSGSQAAKAAGAKVAVVYDKHSDKNRDELKKNMDFFISTWGIFIEEYLL